MCRFESDRRYFLIAIFMEFIRNVFRKKEPDVSEKVEVSVDGESGEETILRLRAKEESRELKSSGENKALFVKLKDDGSAIFKPKNGERSLRTEVKEGTYFKRARAAYLVSKALGFDIVPPTVIRSLDGEIGSIQQFVRNAKTYLEVSSEEKQKILQKHRGQLIALWIFDIIIWNSDRHDSNLLVADDVRAIDNDLSFGEDGLRYLFGYYDTPIPPQIIAGLEHFSSSEDTRLVLKDLLLGLLSEQEVMACFSRIDRIARLIKKGTISHLEKSILETYF